jgi:AraC-like DNA-binding protein
MANGLTSLEQHADLQGFNMDDLTGSFGKSLSGNDSTRLSYKSHLIGDFNVEMEAYNSVLIYNTNIKSFHEDLQIPLYREEPSLTLMFQETGHTIFKKREDILVLAPENHCMYFSPCFDSNLYIKEGHQVEHLIIKLKLDYFENYILDNQHIGGWLYDAMQKNNLIGSTKTNLPLSPEIRTILHQIKNCPYDDVFKELYIDGLIKVLLTHQMNDYNQLFFDKKPGWANDKISRQDVDKLQELKIYLDQHFLESFNIRDLTRHFVLNEYKLKYGFKRMFGTSVMQYVYEKRLNYSRTLLLETDKTIVEISDTIGFNHPNNFSAGFKKRFGCSPSELRLSYQTQNTTSDE